MAEAVSRVYRVPGTSVADIIRRIDHSILACVRGGNTNRVLRLAILSPVIAILLLHFSVCCKGARFGTENVWKASNEPRARRGTFGEDFAICVLL